MDKEILAIIGHLYIENMALKNLIEDIKRQSPQPQQTETKE